MMVIGLEGIGSLRIIINDVLRWHLQYGISFHDVYFFSLFMGSNLV